MTDRSGDSELRKRAAWLLAMLALVAALFVVLFTTLLHTSSGKADNQAGPDDSLGPSQSTSRTSASSSAQPSTSATSSHPGPASCPTSATCALDYDIGNAVDAINAYRKQHDQKAVPGKVSSAAAKCAKSGGDGDCPDGYAETDVAKPTGKAVVDKIEQRAKLNGSMTSFEVGWAFTPGTKEYHFVVIVHAD